MELQHRLADQTPHLRRVLPDNLIISPLLTLKTTPPEEFLHFAPITFSRQLSVLQISSLHLFINLAFILYHNSFFCYDTRWLKEYEAVQYNYFFDEKGHVSQLFHLYSED